MDLLEQDQTVAVSNGWTVETQHVFETRSDRQDVTIAISEFAGVTDSSARSVGECPNDATLDAFLEAQTGHTVEFATVDDLFEDLDKD